MEFLSSLCLLLMLGNGSGAGYAPVDQASLAQAWTEEAIASDIALLEELEAIELTDTERQVLLDELLDFADEGVEAGVEPVGMILSEVGGGNYDDEWNWSPSSRTVYSFDAEVFEIDQMYTQFLQGIASINQDEFTISDIVEEQNEVDWDMGYGTAVVSFLYNDTPCTMTMDMEGDWFDMSAIAQMNKILLRQGNPKQLYYLTDGYQEIIVFYNTSEWAAHFTHCTGQRLYMK